MVLADLRGADPMELVSEASEAAVAGLKFSECLPEDLAAEVFCARFNDAEAVSKILGEPRRAVVEQ